MQRIYVLKRVNFKAERIKLYRVRMIDILMSKILNFNAELTRFIRPTAAFFVRFFHFEWKCMLRLDRNTNIFFSLLSILLKLLPCIQKSAQIVSYVTILDNIKSSWCHWNIVDFKLYYKSSGNKSSVYVRRIESDRINPDSRIVSPRTEPEHIRHRTASRIFSKFVKIV